MNKQLLSERGVTLIELMIASLVMTVGILGFLGVYGNVTRAIQVAKARSLATNIAQEKIESLKNVSYYRLMPTTATATDSNFSPSLIYDTGYYPSQTVIVGGISFNRRVYIRRTAEIGGNLSYVSWGNADTGLKEVLVSVAWKQGQDWRKVEIRNLRNNPAYFAPDATFSGNVKYLAHPVFEPCPCCGCCLRRYPGRGHDQGFQGWRYWDTQKLLLPLL